MVKTRTTTPEMIKNIISYASWSPLFLDTSRNPDNLKAQSLRPTMKQLQEACKGNGSPHEVNRCPHIENREGLGNGKFQDAPVRTQGAFHLAQSASLEAPSL